MPLEAFDSQRDLGEIRPTAEARLAAFAEDDVIGRLWRHDYTLWAPEPTEITNRLGWLTIAETMRSEIDGLEAFAAEVAGDGFTTAVLLGMGGSSLGPEVLQATQGTATGMLTLHVLDSTDPVQVLHQRASIDLAHTLFVVSSKSGGTMETRTQFDYFWDLLPDGAHYVAITDAGSALEALAVERGLRRIFRNPPDIGGRFSVLSFFGLVPAALIGADLPALLDGAVAEAARCRPEVPIGENPAAVLGAIIGEAALAGRDKLTLVYPERLASIGWWIEQLVAESSGKLGRGVLPVEGEPLGGPEVYGGDRLFLATAPSPATAALVAAGQPFVFDAEPDSAEALGAAFFRWELAIALACHILGVNAFDQPNVEEAKKAMNDILAGSAVSPESLAVADALASVRPGDYIAITAYVPRDGERAAALQAARVALRDRFHVATTTGFGPRFLHSTGQLHKGGPNTGVFLQVIEKHAEDAPIPGRSFTFGQLEAAQALGDLASLRAKGRRVARLTLDELRILAAG
jgi:glucose-6-phosphate isomerase